MDKFYYVSSGGTVRGSDGELYHWGWKKKDAKYIKRERKNGKWVYTYPEDQTDKGKSPTGKTTLYDMGKANQSTNSGKGNSTRYNTGVANQVAEAQKEQKKAERQGQIDKAKDALGKFVDGVKDKWEDAKEERKKDWEESKERGTETAKKEATKYDGGIKIRGNRAKDIHAQFTDSDHWLSGTTTIESLTSVNTQYRRGKLERFIDTAKEYIKDRLGYDERDAYRTARLKEAAERVNARRDDSGNSAGKQKANDDTVAKARRDRAEAEDAYFDTALGKLEKARKAGEEWLDKLFGRER